MMLLLVRHGETLSNRQGLLLGRADPPLTDVGEAQARQRRVDVAGSGSRDLQSAAAGTSTPRRRSGSPVEIDERWIELDYGELDERASDTRSLTTTVGTVASRCRRSPRPAASRCQRWRAGFAAACAELAAEAAGSTVVVVTHVSPIKAALAWALDAPIGISWRMYVEDASVSRIDIGPDGADRAVVQSRGVRSRLSASKKASAVSFHVGSDAPRRRAAAASDLAPLVVGGEAAQDAAQAGDVAGIDEATLLAVLDEVGQVARPPADRREPGAQGLGEHRAVRLGVARQDERVGAGVQPGDLLSR